MSINAFAAVGAGVDLLQAFQLNTPVAGRSNIQTLVARNDSGSTANLFIDAHSPDMEYAASIVEACSEQTVYAIQCTKGPSVGEATCGPNAPVSPNGFPHVDD
jgi:hypothetical protein